VSSNIVIRLPFGYDEIIQMYGFPPEDEKERWNWENENLCIVKLPFQIPYSFDKRKVVKSLRVHKKIGNIVLDTFNYIKEKGIEELVKDCAGAYVYRAKRSNPKQLSVHSWGIAIDINCLDNPFGETPKQPHLLVEAFSKFGWVWGGYWKKPDGMHFQYAKGY